MTPGQDTEAGWGYCQALYFFLLSYRYPLLSLAGLFCVVSYSASLWFTELVQYPTAGHSSEHSGCGPPLSVTQPQAQSALYSKHQSLNHSKKSIYLFLTKQNKTLSSALHEAEVLVGKRTKVYCCRREKMLGMLRPEEGWCRPDFSAFWCFTFLFWSFSHIVT